MKKVLVVLLVTALAVFAFGGPYEWHSAPICGHKSGTDDTTFVNAPDYSHVYAVAVAGNGRVWSNSYYGAQRYDKAIMVYDPEFGIIDTVGPEYVWEDSTYVMGSGRFMQTLSDGNVVFGNWGPEFMTVFDQDDYSVVLQSPWCNTGGGIDAFVYNGEQYYISQQILAADVVIWDADFNVIDSLPGGAGGRNIACTRDGSIIISPSLGGTYFIEYAGNPDDGWVSDTVTLAEIGILGTTVGEEGMGNLMYVSSGPNDYIWLFSRDHANDGVFVVDPKADYEVKLATWTDSSVTSLDGFSLGMAVDNQYVIWLSQGLIDTSDHITTLGYQQPWELRAPCQVAWSWSGDRDEPEYLYLADFYGYTLKCWTRTIETGVRDNDVIAANGFELNKAYPNPFNPTTTIPYVLSSNGNVTIDVYDVAGKKVQTLVNEYKFAGNYEVTFNAGNLASGNYYVKMSFGDNSLTQKISLLK
ncbi:MAG: T9SS type A sorting domain-containing protein [Candidatus Marinimicrobia bacterium]|jgi:hypothetical protein|nr:T9SS type A sorting domain-containing protein [Candidatus Neomarinimicrobiota bacterium]MDD5709898.1 T9SS type A sorting domain-containing protein [Candidatus Neomarinimicrobiota bacterium]MDX9778400.1 T9SS type A sorting domain-containing protein [bacterium]